MPPGPVVGDGPLGGVEDEDWPLTALVMS
jgi:hypothetical protein